MCGCLFYFVENIKQFQVIQKNINEIQINIVTLDNKKLEHRIENEIGQKIKIVMGKNCKVIFEYLESIEPSSSGKFRYTISLVKNG